MVASSPQLSPARILACRRDTRRLGASAGRRDVGRVFDELSLHHETVGIIREGAGLEGNDGLATATCAHTEEWGDGGDAAAPIEGSIDEAVAVTIEPSGGSPAPTSDILLITSL
jgi:hypothetical protein